MMAECVNCKAKLADKNTAVPLVGGAPERLCTKCHSKLQMAIRNGKLSLHRIDDADQKLRVMGWSEDGIAYIRTYAKEKHMSPEERAAAAEERKAAQQEEQIKSGLQSLDITHMDKSIAIQALKEAGADCYYEYKVITVNDISGLGGGGKGKTGHLDVGAMTAALNELGLVGWRLVAAYDNTTSASHIAGVLVAGVADSTEMSEHVLIFERKVKIKTD